MSTPRRIGGARSARGRSPLEAQQKALAAARRRAPVFLLFGDEQYLIEDTARRIVGMLLPEKQREVGLEVLSGTSIPESDLSAALASLPLFGGLRAVWFRNCGLFHPRERGEIIRPRLPRKGEPLVVIITEPSADRRLLLYKEIEKRGIACGFPLFSDSNDDHLRSIHSLISKKLAADRKEISPGTLFSLVQLVGADLQALMTEVEKLALYTGSRRRIESRDIDAVVSLSRETAAYQIADAVSAGDLERSLALVDSLLGQGLHPLAIQAMILKRVRFLLQAREIMESDRRTRTLPLSRYPAFKAAAQRIVPSLKTALGGRKGHNLFGEHPYVIFRIFTEARGKSLRRLREQLDRTLRADEDLKGRRSSKRAALEDLVISLCREELRTAAR